MERQLTFYEHKNEEMFDTVTLRKSPLKFMMIQKVDAMSLVIQKVDAMSLCHYIMVNLIK